MVCLSVLVKSRFIDFRACNINMKTLGTVLEVIIIEKTGPKNRISKGVQLCKLQ